VAWFKVDDGLHASAKSRRAGDAMALWVMAGSWCADQLTDGWLPADMAPVLTRNWKKQSAKLVEVGLWKSEQRDGEQGWRFHDWEVYQPARLQVLAEREAAAERQRRARERAKQRRDEEAPSPVSHGVTDGVTTPVSHGPPDPTRPDLKIKDTCSPPASEPPDAAKPKTTLGSDTDPQFVRFWAAYPRRAGKGQARKAWAKAVKAGADPEAIVEAAGRFTAQRGNEDPKFTPYPATWLNGERWDDAPEPKRADDDRPAGWWELWDE
jgi:hypothetical protein